MTDPETRDTTVVSKEQPVLGRRITGWTNNLVATSIVLLVMLVVGRQLVSVWVGDRTTSQQINDTTTVASQTETWPDLASANLQFGDGPWQLHRKKITLRNSSDGQTMQQALLEHCRRELVGPADSVLRSLAYPVSQAERDLLKNAENWIAVKSKPGKWRLFDGIKNESVQSNDLATVIGIRDDCRDAEDKACSRLVVFGLAVPESPGSATLMLFKTSGESELNLIPIPDGCKRSMSIGSGHSRLIGFTGGSHAGKQEPNEIMEFYDRWSREFDWSAITEWSESNETWHRRFEPTNKPSKNDRLGDITGFSVQLGVDPANVVRGLITVDVPATGNAN